MTEERFQTFVNDLCLFQNEGFLSLALAFATNNGIFHRCYVADGGMSVC